MRIDCVIIGRGNLSLKTGGSHARGDPETPGTPPHHDRLRDAWPVRGHGISDQLAIMANGLIEQVGTPIEISERPANEFITAFVGYVNFTKSQE